MIASTYSATLETPEFPSAYSSNLTCVWKIALPEEHFAEIKTGFVSNDTCCELLEVSKIFMLSLFTELDTKNQWPQKVNTSR